MLGYYCEFRVDNADFMSFLSFFVKSLIENVFLKNLRINIKVYTFAKFFRDL